MFSLSLETYLELCHTTWLKFFSESSSWLLAFNFIAKSFIIDIWQGLSHLRANPTKWSNTFEQFVGNSQLFKCFYHFAVLSRKMLSTPLKLADQKIPEKFSEPLTKCIQTGGVFRTLEIYFEYISASNIQSSKYQYR